MMKCPTCAADMDEHLRHGVRIDHCPNCGGVWLDKGELDHLMAAVRPSVVLPDPEPAPAPAPAPERVPAPQPAPRRDRADTSAKERKPDKGRRGPGKAHRYGGRYSSKARFMDLLEEIFDFD